VSYKTLQPGDPPVLRQAFACLDLREIAGPEHNPDIVKLFVEAGHPEVRDDETSWCAAFANAMLKRAGIAGTGQLNARSFLSWGKRTDRPRRGDVVVIKRGTSNWQGHVFFWLGEDAQYVYGIGGNQGKFGAVTVSKFAKAKLLGIRRAVQAGAEAPAPEPARSPDLVEAVQRALREHGYPQVGQVDGQFGPDTRGAILAFEADNGLELRGEATAEILAAILAAPVKPPAPERSAATPAEVREKAPEVKATWQSKLAAFWGMICTGIATAIGFVSENIGEVKERVQPVLDVFGDVPWWAYGLLFVVGFWLVWQRIKASEQGQIDAFRSGDRR
jgi:uncharacterized protein (TIGR02594 family)